MRLPEQTPVRIALKESLNEVKRKVGRPKLTWIKVIEKDLTSIDIHLNVNAGTPEQTITKLKELTENRSVWRKQIRDIMAVNC